jgi:hypothetical protein
MPDFTSTRLNTSEIIFVSPSPSLRCASCRYWTFARQSENISLLKVEKNILTFLFWGELAPYGARSPASFRVLIS